MRCWEGKTSPGQAVQSSHTFPCRGRPELQRGPSPPGAEDQCHSRLVRQLSPCTQYFYVQQVLPDSCRLGL